MKKIKKPYSSIKAICTIALMLLMQTSFAQEVDTQQQTNTDATTVTDESSSNIVSVLGESRAAGDIEEIGNLQWDMLFPTSPNSVFKTDKSYNMDMSTGKANIHVPIVEAGPEEIQVPVALSYTTGGIKVRDVASWVGLGWNLSAGGKITRMMNKFPDKLDGSMDPLLNPSTWICPTKNQEGNYSARVKTEDTQPDLFYFEILGKSGIFVLDSQGNAATIPYQNIKITYDKSAKTFDILDDSGINYSFQDIETTRVITKEGAVKRDTINYESTWNLTNINGKGESVDFEYKALDSYLNSYEYDVYSKSLTAVYNNNEKTFSAVTYNVKVTPRYLTSISWGNGKIEFISSKDREDIPEQAYKLDAIKIYSGKFTDILIKSYNLEYGSFANKSLKLDKINITTPKSVGSTFFRKFEYFTDCNLPEATPDIQGSVGYYDFDHWGYYNGENTDTGEGRGIPDIKIPEISYIKKYDVRTPNLAYTRANSLKKVWVSSSAYDEFEYELNTEKFKFSNTEFGTIGGLRIKSITTKSTELPNSSKKVKYEYADDAAPSSGVVFKDPNYYILTSNIVVGQFDYYYKRYFIIKDSPISSLFDLDGSHIRYGRVKEIFDNGSSNTYYYTTKADQPDAGYVGIYNKDQDDPSVTVTYKLLADANSDYAPENTRFWKRGLLTKKISSNGLGIETYKETYKYNLDAPTKKTVKGIYPIVVTNLLLGKGNKPFPCLIEYEYISQPFYITEKTVVGTDVPETTTKYIYDDKDNNNSDLDHILLKETIETSGGVSYKTTYKYPLDYTNIYGEEGNAIKFMRDYNMTSIPIEIVKYEKSAIVGAELYIYGTFQYMSNGSITGAMFNLKEVKELLLNKPKLGSSFIASHHEPSLGGYKFVHDADYVTKTAYEYNQANKVNCIKERNKLSQVILYNDSNTMPIANIRNAEAKVLNGSPRHEAFYTSFEDTKGRTHARAKTGAKVLAGGYYTDMSQLVPGSYWVSYWESYNDGVDWVLYESEVEVWENDNRKFSIGNQGAIIDEYRIWKKGSQIQTKTYDASSNITSETDENGKTTYYEYDALNRLIRVLNNKRNQVKGYEYFIKN